MGRSRTPKDPTPRRSADQPTGAARLERNGILPGNPGNSGGKKGRSGRPPKAFKDFCAGLAKTPSFQNKLAATSRNPKHPAYMRAVQLVAAYAEGLPPQAITVAGELNLNVNDARQRLADRLAKRALAG